ncbi:isovaleryl-CoA dehydrogenase precursor [Thermoplasma volcanium GSS1]|uniref:Isovaleryl-CoA dehydrogenase n=1 Tax=Thermoplasma volcanium (strain ATCC 51530 / DSM 4299 / JCM 9571 / NBRC 15438 / GSS1) TaxID=273116 RepID=Q977Y0_THEVO|nr:acyl-CoA dehydrogenase family protein [Thermoplasma volcanium]BAB60434.1 isovaleryl-CoA dehydrogenase precursor [Thermoplasma volcanium GSS1]
MHSYVDADDLLRNSIKEFVKKEVEPIRMKIDREDYFPVDVFKEMGKLGYLGVTIPQEYGGSDAGYITQAVIEEELGYSSPSLALSYGAHSNLCLDNVYRNGSQAIREKFVPKLASGEWIGSLCLTEPGSGSDALAMHTTLHDHGGRIFLTGSKTFITNGPYADLFLVHAKDGDSYTSVIVLSSDKGFERGKKFEKMGMRGSPTGELFFNDIDIGNERIVGKRGDGKRIIMSGLNSERVILAFIFVGLARRALDEAVKYSSERKQFSLPISEFELIQEKLAYMYTKYETSRILAYRALEKLESSRDDPLYAAAAIMHASESAEYIAREAIQIFGGYGYIKDTGIEMFLRDAILGQIGAGTTEIRKRIIAKSLIRKYKLGEDIN